MFGVGLTITTHKVIGELIAKGIDKDSIISITGVSEEDYLWSLSVYRQYIESSLLEPKLPEPEVTLEARKLLNEIWLDYTQWKQSIYAIEVERARKEAKKLTF